MSRHGRAFYPDELSHRSIAASRCRSLSLRRDPVRFLDAAAAADRYCYPLTVVDHVSRYLLACEAFPSNEGAHTRRACERIFREYGLPRAILSDNGSPFGSPGLARLSTLSLWWTRLGSGVERIVPGHPEQNGADERMHRTLKAETARSPESTMERQQKRFDEFRHVYNHERPHEALGQKRPATIYRPSPRPYPETLPPIQYAGHLQVRKIEHNAMCPV